MRASPKSPVGLEELYKASSIRDELMQERYDLWLKAHAGAGELARKMPTDLRLWLVDELTARLAYDTAET